MKNLLISASLIAIGVWYFHRVAEDRAEHPVVPEEHSTSEMVVANAPDGTLKERWGNTAPTPSPSK